MHDALKAILALHKFVRKNNLSDVKYKNATFSACDTFNALIYQKKVYKQCPFLQIFIKRKVLNVCMAKKQLEIALNLDNLNLTHSRDEHGIRVLFTEVSSNGSVRMPTSNKVIEAVRSSFSSPRRS